MILSIILNLIVGWEVRSQKYILGLYKPTLWLVEPPPPPPTRRYISLNLFGRRTFPSYYIQKGMVVPNLKKIGKEFRILECENMYINKYSFEKSLLMTRTRINDYFMVLDLNLTLIVIRKSQFSNKSSLNCVLKYVEHSQ